VQKRLAAHKISKGAKYTKHCKKPILVYTEHRETLTTAMQREKQIKHWSRAKKEALISNNLDLLKSL
jgi:putative endonuclease